MYLTKKKQPDSVRDCYNCIWGSGRAEIQSGAGGQRFFAVQEV